MASTYTPIATTTLGSAAANVVLSSIPSTYTDLVLIISSRSDDGSNRQGINLYPNADFSNNKSNTGLWGDGSLPYSARNSNVIGIQDYATVGTLGASEFAVTIWNIMNYSNTTTYKTLLSRRSSASSQTVASVGLMRVTSAISSLNIYPAFGNFVTGSTFTLYGIKSA